MQREDVERLLRLRWQLTGQRMGEDTVEAWTDMLAKVDADQATRALKAAAMSTDRVTYHVLVEHMAMTPRKPAEATCSWCDGTGWREAPRAPGRGEWAHVTYSWVEPCLCQQPGPLPIVEDTTPIVDLATGLEIARQATARERARRAI